MKKIKTYNLFLESNTQKLKVNSEDEYHFIPFSIFDHSVCINDRDDYVLCFSEGFIYDYVTDEDITNALNTDLSKIDVSKDWNNSSDREDFQYETAFTNKEKHILRVAKLVQEIKSGKSITPVSMFFDERSYMHDIPNYIEDGNHRLRALQYLGYKSFPAYVYGNFTEPLLQYLKDNNLNEAVQYNQDMIKYKKDIINIQTEMENTKEVYKKKIEDCLLYLTDEPFVIDYFIEHPDKDNQMDDDYFIVDFDINKLSALYYGELIESLKRCFDKLKHDLNVEGIHLHCKSDTKGSKMRATGSISYVNVNEDTLDEIYALDGSLVEMTLYFK